MLAKADQSADPERYRTRWLEQLLHQAREAEERARTTESTYAAAIDAMERAEAARRATKRTEQLLRRLHGEKVRDHERLRRNARQRETYRRRRSEGDSRLETRTGMHALAIDVDPTAYAALKIDARARRSTIPRRLGELLTDALAEPATPTSAPGPRWHRTGEGRRATTHVRIDIAPDAWDALHEHAYGEELTVGRWIGRAVETWANRS